MDTRMLQITKPCGRFLDPASTTGLCLIILCCRSLRILLRSLWVTPYTEHAAWFFKMTFSKFIFTAWASCQARFCLVVDSVRATQLGHVHIGRSYLLCNQSFTATYVSDSWCTIWKLTDSFTEGLCACLEISLQYLISSPRPTWVLARTLRLLWRPPTFFVMASKHSHHNLQVIAKYLGFPQQKCLGASWL